MKYVPTPDFAAKVTGANASSLRAVKRFVEFIGSSSSDEIFAASNVSILTGSELSVWRDEDAWIIFSIGIDDAGNEYVLIADLVDLDPNGRPELASQGGKNPRTNKSLNPRVNSKINPRTNSNLNPRVNSQLNPRVNSALNPRVNSALNPRVNSSINYRVNSSINPRVNSSINPRVNSTINPRVNAKFSGPFIYDLEFNKLGFAVRANDAVTLVFDLSNSLLWIAVARAGGFSVFNDSNQYEEHWVSDGQGGYLRFSLNNDWIGLVV